MLLPFAPTTLTASKQIPCDAVSWYSSSFTGFPMPTGGLLTSLIQRPARWLLLLLLAVTAGLFLLRKPLSSTNAIRLMEKRYGTGARTRLLDRQNLVQTTGGDDRARLERVNRFFNVLAFVDDEIHWKKVDYWATPIEFLPAKAAIARILPSPNISP